MTPLLPLTAIALALTIAGLVTYKALSVLRYYESNPLRQDAQRLALVERRWRICAHILWFFALAPVPLLLTFRINTLADLMLATVGTTATVGIVLAVVKFALKTNFTHLFSADVALWNETALALAGFGAALIAAVALTLLSRPDLHKVIKKVLFS
jgi:hypothetical protein